MPAMLKQFNLALFPLPSIYSIVTNLTNTIMTQISKANLCKMKNLGYNYLFISVSNPRMEYEIS